MKLSLSVNRTCGNRLELLVDDNSNLSNRIARFVYNLSFIGHQLNFLLVNFSCLLSVSKNKGIIRHNNRFS